MCAHNSGNITNTLIIIAAWVLRPPIVYTSYQSTSCLYYYTMLDPLALYESIHHSDSIFYDTYVATRKRLEEIILVGGYDVLIELNCTVGLT